LLLLLLLLLVLLLLLLLAARPATAGCRRTAAPRPRHQSTRGT
jgi:hypothetical protein